MHVPHQSLWPLLPLLLFLQPTAHTRALPAAPPITPARPLLLQADAAKGRDKAAAEARALKAKVRLDGAIERATAVEKAPPPKLEVGSFEEVRRMQVALAARGRRHRGSGGRRRLA
jgi:hypothetical protein